MGVFKAQRTPESVLEDVFRLDDAERELARFRAPLDVEGKGDREEILAIHAAASKQLAKLPARVGSYLGSLS
ncbi:hypothetical protein [Streptomyces sp. NPDC058066]|uniref:hypothetical protein n=1 Tax=Streptomyces sp. NPDC058066 TaxID=3346323 RepID=UPI0036EFE3FA